MTQPPPRIGRTVPPSTSLSSRWYFRFITAACGVCLGLTVLGVFIGLTNHARYDHRYGMVALIVALGLVALLYTWAQQVIATRDAAASREMVEWQIKAAKRRMLEKQAGTQAEMHDPVIDYYSDFYYEILVDELAQDMQLLNAALQARGNADDHA